MFVFFYSLKRITSDAVLAKRPLWDQEDEEIFCSKRPKSKQEDEDDAATSVRMIGNTFGI